MLNGLDLFSGIGGISLALEPWVRPIAYCENDKYAQGVLLSRMSCGDIPKTLHYLDPPYWPESRRKRVYKHETDKDFHRRLVDFIKDLDGKVILSGYDSDEYSRLGWRKVNRKAFADGAKARVEVLWMNFDPINLEVVA